MSKNFLTIGLFSFIFLALFSQTVSAYYVDFYVNTSVEPGQNINIIGTVINTSVSDTIPTCVNMSLVLPNGSTMSSVCTNSSFIINMSTGGFNLTDYTLYLKNNGTALNKSATFRVTNVTSASVSILNIPPFSPNTLLRTNVTAKNSSNMPVSTQNITGKIYASDGPQPSGWGTNTSITNTNGIAYLNFSIPSTAALGRYMIDIENGAGTAFFVLTRYTTSVLTKDYTGSTRVSFSPGSNVTIEVTIKSNDVPQASVPIQITVFDPSNLPTSSSVLSTSTNGTASYTYTPTSTGGTYKVKVNASGEETFTSFMVKTFSVSLEPYKESVFFETFGGQQYFKPGQPILLTIVPADVGSGSLLQRDVNYTCNGSYIKIADTWNVNGSKVNSSVISGISSLVSLSYQMTPVCGVNFSLSSNFVGTFGIKINLTVGTSLDLRVTNSTESGQGYFTIQKYGLRVEPASSFGEKEMHTMLLPSDNTSFNLYAFNISTGLDLGGSSITAATITSIRSLRGGTENTTMPQRFYLNTTYEDAPYIEATLPPSTGPQMVTITATVAGETVTGTAMYMGKYLMGYAQASGTRFDEGGGSGPGGSSGQFISCTGTVQFSTMVFDSKTMMPASSVTFMNLIEAREEMTGTDIRSCLNVTRATTDSTGRATINVTFSSACGLSGFHFMNFNVSYRDKTDEIPGGFECKQLNFQPESYINGMQGFNTKGTDPVTFKVRNVSYTNNASKIVTYGTVNITRIMNFNPAVGPTLLNVRSGVVLGSIIDWNKTGDNSYSGNATVYPANFSLTEWPSGFFDARVQVTDLNRTVSGTGTGGFGSVAFETVSNWYGSCYGPPEQCGSTANTLGSTVHRPSEEISMVIYANLPTGADESSNSSGTGHQVPFLAVDWANTTHQNLTRNVSYVNVTIIDMMSGNSYTPTNIILSAVNSSMSPFASLGDPFVTWENYTLNFTLPANIKDSQYMGQIKVTTNTSLTATEVVSFEVKGLTIGLPIAETWQERWRYGSGDLNQSYEVMILDAYGDCGSRYPAEVCAANKLNNDTWTALNWTYIKNLVGITNQSLESNTQGAQICTKAHLNLTSSQGWPNDNNINYSTLVFTNSTHSFLFLGNRSHNYNSYTVSNIHWINLTSRIPGTKVYLWNIADCGYVTFVNATTLNSSTQGRGTVSSDFTWTDYFLVNKDFYLPFAVFIGSDTGTTSAVRQAGYNVTIKDVVEMNREGFGVGSPLNSSLWNYTSASLTNNDGIVFVKLHVQNNSKFMAFWQVNTTPRKTSSNFKRALQFGVKGFNAYGNFVKLLPEVSKRIVLTPSSQCTWLQNTSAVNTTCYNATLNESTAGERFTTTDSNRTFYFVLANDSVIDASPTNKYRYLFIDDDPYINLTSPCVIQSQRVDNESDTYSGICEGQGYPPVKIDITSSSSRDDWFGSTNAVLIGFDDVFINSSHAIVTSFQSTPGLNWSTVSSSTERMGVKICTKTFSFDPVNASVNIRFANWMNAMPWGDINNITMYNLTTGIAFAYPQTLHTSIYNGCFLTEILPNSTSKNGEWTSGRNEIMGTATATGGATGVEYAWTGPVEYWEGGGSYL